MQYHRKSIRLKGYNYSENWYYFVTVCCQNREKLFGEIGNGQMILNEIGKNIKEIFLDYFNNICFKLDEFMFMPDHIHMIIVIKNQFNNVGAGLVPALNDNKRATTRVAPTLGKIIGELKSIITNEYIKNIKINNWPKFDKRLWQRNYYERIIRNEKEYLRIREYIRNNPKN